MMSETEDKCVEVFKPQDMTLPIQTLFDELLSFID